MFCPLPITKFLSGELSSVIPECYYSHLPKLALLYSSLPERPIVTVCSTQPHHHAGAYQKIMKGAWSHKQYSCMCYISSLCLESSFRRAATNPKGYC